MLLGISRPKIPPPSCRTKHYKRKNMELSRPTYGIIVSFAILLRRKFIYDKLANGMLINTGIVFTFTRQRWSSTTFSSYLALLVWRSNIRNLLVPHLPTYYSRNRTWQNTPNSAKFNGPYTVVFLEKNTSTQKNPLPNSYLKEPNFQISYNFQLTCF